MSALYPLPRNYRFAPIALSSGQTVLGPFDFRVYDIADVQVLIKQTGDTQYSILPGGFTVTPIGDLPNFFTVTLGTVYPDGTFAMVKGRRLQERSTDVTRAGTIRSVDLEKELDKQSVVLQELRRDVDAVAGPLVPADPTSGFAPVSVMSFGAIPNSNLPGVPAINRLAFTAAFAASKMVYGPPGRIFYTEAFSIPANSHLYGAFSLVAAGAIAATGLVTVADDVTIEWVNIGVNKAVYPTVLGVFVNAAHKVTLNGLTLSGADKCVGINASDDITVADCRIADCNYAITVSGGNRTIIRDNRISIATNYAIYSNTSTADITIAGNRIETAGQGIVLIDPVGATVVRNRIKSMTGGFGIGIGGTAGSEVLIDHNRVLNAFNEAIHCDGITGLAITNNICRWTVAGHDTGISVSADNGVMSLDFEVAGNVVISPASGAILITEARRGIVHGNYIYNANSQNLGLNNVAGVRLDASTTFPVQDVSVFGNHFFDNLGLMAWQVQEFTAGGGATNPNNNFIGPQYGRPGTLGYVATLGAATSRVSRAGPSANSTTDEGGFYFDAHPFAKRDIAGTNVYLYDYSDTLIGALGSAGSPLTSWANTNHQWSSRGSGTYFVGLSSAGWNWRIVAAPAAAAVGTGNVYVDSTSLALVNKDSNGNVHTTVSADAGASNNFLTGITTAGAITKAQPTFTNISGTATAGQGGTGQSSYTIGDLLYASGTSALSKLAGVATGNALLSGGVGTAPSFGKIGLSTHVSGTLPAANGGFATDISAQSGVPLFAAGVPTFTSTSGTGNFARVNTPAFTTPAIGAATGSSLTLTAPSSSTQIFLDLRASSDVSAGALAIQMANNSGVAKAFQWTDAVSATYRFKSAGSINFHTNDVAISAAGLAMSIDVSQIVSLQNPLQHKTYTVATLPTGATGQECFATDCRVFNGAGVQEGAASGTGGLVSKNASAWKIAGTNITAVA